MSDHEEVEMEEQVEQPKKGRGRPKKAATKAKAEEKSSDEPQVKRGRGRPPASGPKAEKAKPAPKPKKPAADDAGNDIEDGAEAAPKRRGRAPKAVSKPDPESESEHEDNASEEEEPAPPVKAKNGKAGDKKPGKNAAKNGHADGEEDDDADHDDEPEEEVKSDAASSDSRIKIVVEHCKSCQTFRRKAEEIIDALKEKWSGIEVEYNPMAKPRKGAFEINLINNDGKEVPLWTGLELGPPRKLKFPEPEAVVEVMEKVYVPETD